MSWSLIATCHLGFSPPALFTCNGPSPRRRSGPVSLPSRGGEVVARNRRRGRSPICRKGAWHLPPSAASRTTRRTLGLRLGFTAAPWVQSLTERFPPPHVYARALDTPHPTCGVNAAHAFEPQNKPECIVPNTGFPKEHQVCARASLYAEHVYTSALLTTSSSVCRIAWCGLWSRQTL